MHVLGSLSESLKESLSENLGRRGGVKRRGSSAAPRPLSISRLCAKSSAPPSFYSLQLANYECHYNITMAATTASPLVARSKRIKFNDPIRIEVGPEDEDEDESEVFIIESEALVHRSLFFRKALSGGFKEAQERVVKLPEDDPEIFGIYLHHVQTNEFSVLPDSLSLEDNGYEETLIKLYVLAEKLQDTRFKNAIVRAVIGYCHQSRPNNRFYSLGQSVTRLLYEGTSPGSNMRRVVVEMKAWDHNNLEGILRKGWPYEFLAELAYESIKCRDTKHDKKKKYWRRDHPEDYMEEETED